MSDGHSGISNEKVNEGGSGNFRLFLSALKDNRGRISFIIHATSSSIYFSGGLQPLDFLQNIGFSHFGGECPFFRERCFWREIAYLEIPKGFTVDIFANTKDGSKKFGFEVTGIDGAIDKKSNKLTQVLEFERIKEHDEKAILLVNTYKNTPIKNRSNKVSFTEPVVNFLSKHPIRLMTGYDLYRMVQDVMEKGKNKKDLIEILHNTQGVLKY